MSIVFERTGADAIGPMGWLTVLVAMFCMMPATAQTITVVGTPHLTGLDRSPTAEQLAHSVDALSRFEPTQVCVERMSGERIQVLAKDPAQHGMTLRPETHGRPIATVILPLGVEMQFRVDRGPRQARAEARDLIATWDRLETSDRLRAIGLQVAGYEFHSAVLNWTWLDDAERRAAKDHLPADVRRSSKCVNRSTRSIPSVCPWRAGPVCTSCARLTLSRTKVVA